MAAHIREIEAAVDAVAGRINAKVPMTCCTIYQREDGRHGSICYTRQQDGTVSMYFDANPALEIGVRRTANHRLFTDLDRILAVL